MRQETHQGRSHIDRRRTGAVLLLIGCLLLIGGCGKDPGPSRPPAVNGTESFTFFDLGRNSVLDDDTRQRLSRELGDVAVERRGILNLAPDGLRLVADHLPLIDRLNRRLNKDFRERVEHDLLTLMYRYPGRTSPAFESVRLIFDLSALRPLHFQITANQVGAEILKVLNEKYGSPQRIADRSGDLLIWERQGDRLLVLPRRNRLGQPEYHIRIYFMGNIETLIGREKNDTGSGAAKDARSAF